MKILDNKTIKNTKIYIGPVSKNVVDSIIDLCNDNNINIGMIASRRQIDYDGGYVNKWKTTDFIRYVRHKTDKIILCRDHGGISQGKHYDNGTMSFYNDTEFDIIHIDPFKKYKNMNDAINETVDNIKFINFLNSNVKFEVGTEESIFGYNVDDINFMLGTLQDKLGDIYKNISYCVIQSGTKLVGTKNIGKFSEDKCESMIKVCHKNGVLSKEHNGDYLEDADISKRFDIGLDAINIAPEFGVFETKTILNHIKNKDHIDSIYEMCLESGKWKKWVQKDFNPDKNKIKIIEISGHYIFDNDDFKKIKYTIPNIDNEIKYRIKEKIKNLLKLTK